jgi:hypothetical protein
MRLVTGFTIVFALAFAPMASGQQAVKEERRFGIALNTELYPQDQPKSTLSSLIRALDRERYDYVTAHLLDPAYVDEQLRSTLPEFETAARAQIASEQLDKRAFSKEFINERIRELAAQENFASLVRRVRKTLDDNPESVKQLRKLAREGDFPDGAESTSVTHKDIKDRALFMRKILGRWYLENKMQE